MINSVCLSIFLIMFYRYVVVDHILYFVVVVLFWGNTWREVNRGVPLGIGLKPLYYVLLRPP